MPDDPKRVEVIVVNMLESEHPTGMAVAGEAVRFLLQGSIAREGPSWIPRIVRFINNSLPSGIVQMLFRCALAQIIPLLVRGSIHLIFTSHHAPLWKTGRHSMIVHDLISIEFPFQHRAQTLYFLLLLPRLLRAASRTIFISHSVEALARRHLSGELSGNVWVIPSYNRRLAEYLPSTISLPSRIAARRFFLVGARFPHKNLTLVLLAAKALGRRGESNFKISVMGCTDALWEQDGLAELKAHGVVETSDYAAQEEVEGAYREATAFIYVSLAEGQGLPPIEAMAQGCPVIAADVPVLRETCGDGAQYVKPGDFEGLADLMQQILRGEMKEELVARQSEGYRQAARYSRESITTKWTDFVSSLGAQSI